MEKEDLADLLKQHEERYRQALYDLVENNTSVLIDDIVSLIKKPPLDSMDLVRTKILDLAKKNKVVINTKELDTLLDQQRKIFMKCCDEIRKVRISQLRTIIERSKITKKGNFIKINKSDFLSIHKKIKAIFKKQLVDSYEKSLLKYLDSIFKDSVSLEIKNKIRDDLSKYLLGSYQKQLLENVELKILVKDTTFLNSLKEQGERYLYTLEHSRLLNEIES